MSDSRKYNPPYAFWYQFYKFKLHRHNMLNVLPYEKNVFSKFEKAVTHPHGTTTTSINLGHQVNLDISLQKSRNLDVKVIYVICLVNYLFIPLI